LHGYDPKEAIIQIVPKNNEYILETREILAAIEEHGSSVALLLFSGVQYYTGK
jgi:kynureninase